MVTFTHLDPSTPEEDWIRAGVRTLPLLDPALLSPETTLIVLAAHPDDELLGCPTLLAAAHHAGCGVVPVLFTAGEHSHPGSPTLTPAELATIRLAEFAALGTDLFPGTQARMESFTDGQLAARREDVLRVIDDAVAAASPGPVLIAAPRRDDGHSDHETVGQAALEVGAARGATVLEYPIWYWHWATPEDARWRSWVRLPDAAGLDLVGLTRDGLWARYPSQTEPLSPAPGDEPILGADFLEHFRRDFDTFALTAPAENGAMTATEVFDALHREREDPWSLYSSPYEVRKRNTLMGLLRGASEGSQVLYERVLEIGCSVGALTGELAGMSRSVVAVDASEAALDSARVRQADKPNVVFERAVIPDEWPEGGPYDLVVISETGYYLTESELRGTLDRVEVTGTPDLRLALCHYTGSIDGWPLNAEQVHLICREYWEASDKRTVTVAAHHEDSEFIIDILDLRTAR
jgi:LmbE family N-acetylglucosaminyl deacetylase/SAM-dependent methyltransferase